MEKNGIRLLDETQLSPVQREGVKVIHSIEDLKVHSKIVLVNRREGSRTKGYAYIGTGNFNEKSARIYSDFGLADGIIRQLYAEHLHNNG